MARSFGARLVERFTIFVAIAVQLVTLFGLRDVLLSPLPARAMVAAPAAVPAGDASCEVHVVDAEGRPLAEAVVRVFHVDGSGEVFFAGEQWTRSSEALSFPGLPRGETWVLAYGRNKSRASTRVMLDPIEGEVGPPKRSVTLALRDANALAVRVVGEKAEVIPGATVTVVSTDALPHVVIADGEGLASFDRLGPPPWSVTASAEGYDPVSRSGVYPDVAPLEIKLERLGGLEVSVVDVDGKAVPDAEVMLSGPTVWPARSAKTDEEGKVTIVGLYAGLYDLKARRERLVSATDMSVPVAQGKLVERTLVLREGRFVTVTVTDGPVREGGLEPPPIEGAAVVLVEEGLSSFPIQQKTNKQGMAVLGPISEEAVTISARAEGFVPRVVGNDAVKDDAVTIPLLRGGAIAGDVRDERGFPIDGAIIEVLGTDVDGMPIHETTDRSTFRDDLFEFAMGGPTPLLPRGELGVMPGPIPPIPHAGGAFSTGGEGRGGEPWVTQDDGTFRCSPVTPGRVQVLVHHPEYVEALSDVFTLPPGGERTVHIVLRRGGRLEGRVLEEDRMAVAGARVEVAALEGTFTQVTYTTDDGSFAFAAVPEAVLVTVYRGDSLGEIAARVDLEVEPNRRRTIEIVLPKPREPTTLRFVDERGFPVSRVEARVVSLDLGTALFRTHFTNDDGEVEVPGARGLPLRIVAERPGRAPLVETLAEAGKVHTFTMRPGFVLKGEVTGKGGRVQIAEADITLFTEAGSRHTKTAEDGTFQIDDLALGRARLVVRAADYADDERVLMIEGDGRRPIQLDKIDLLASGSVEGKVETDAGEAVAGARVGVGAVPTYLPVGKLPHGIVQTDADGRFELAGVPSGMVDLEAYSPELGRGRVTGVEVRADRVTRRVTITIPAQDYTPPKIKAAGSIAVTLAERGGGVVIVDVPEGGEAELGGIEPGDRIVSLAGRATATIEQARDALSGPLNEDVIAVVERTDPSGAARTLTLRVRRESVRR